MTSCSYSSSVRRRFICHRYGGRKRWVCVDWRYCPRACGTFATRSKRYVKNATFLRPITGKSFGTNMNIRYQESVDRSEVQLANGEIPTIF